MTHGARSSDRENSCPPDWPLARQGDSFFCSAPDWAPGFLALGYGLEGDGPREQHESPGRRPPETLNHGRGTLLVRRYTHGGLLRGLTGERFKNPDRLLAEVQLTRELARRGILVPEVVSMRALCRGPRSWQLELGTRMVEGARDLRSFLADRSRGKLSEVVWRRLLTRAGQALAGAHQAGLDHVDLQPANLLACQEELKAGEAARIWILDLDRCRLDQGDLDRVATRNLARLMRWITSRYSSESPFSDADLMRFMRAYEPDRRRRKRLIASVVQILHREGPFHRAGRVLERWLGLSRQG